MTTATTASLRTSPNPASERIFNFSAGPAILPEPVLRAAQEAIWNIDGSGVGIMEHSHRGKLFDRVLDEAIADCRRIAGLGDDHEVLFLQGGATTQFTLIPMNFLPEGKTADYPDTGVWTTKAIKEAKAFGRVNVAFEGKASQYDHTPGANELKLTDGAAYLHYCANNTIYGTQYPQPPQGSAPLISDMSSEMFSRPLDFKSHALCYAGAQKNLGPAGVVLVLIDKAFMETGKTGLPSMFEYRNHAAKKSCLNTAPTFSIYVVGQVFKWILEQGGLEAIDQRNREKAKIVYDAIDNSGGFYTGFAHKDCRSLMNVTFRTPSADLDETFVKEAGGQGMSGLKGHRDLGGLRASIYNAFPKAGCEALAQFMKDFAQRNG